MSTHSSSAVASSTPSPSPSATSAAATTSTSNSPTTLSTTNAASSSSPSSSSSGSTASSSSTITSVQTSSSATANLQTTQVVTGGITSVLVQPPQTSSPTPQTNSSSSNSFFQNTGAVAGVFAVVGLVVVVLAIALIINCIRRRRAQKFDRDVAQAAAEAAASSRSPFEDYSYANTGGSPVGGYGYSGDSHGTYQLPPVQPNDTYGMSEMSQYDPYAAGAVSVAAAAAIVDRSRSRKESEPGTPGLAGVGARGLAREPSKHAPYHAFAGPVPPSHELQGSGSMMRSPRSMNQDVLEAVGLSGPSSGPYPPPNVINTTTNNNSGSAFVARKPSELTQQTHTSGRSQFGSINSHPTLLQPGHPVIDSYYPQRHDSLSPDPFAGYPPQVLPATSTTTLPNPHDGTLPSPSLPGHQSDHNEEYPELGSPTALRSEEQRMSYQDDTDYSQGHRVLRVANE